MIFLKLFFSGTSFIAFSRDLYHELVASSKKPLVYFVIWLDGSSSNFFISPLSVYSALSLAFAGSAGKSREEFISTLHLPDEGDHLKTLGDGIRSIFKQDAK